MPDVAVTIAGRVYRVACDEGEEARLADLASLLDGKIERMRENFGEIGDQRLTIMAAITLADEVTEAGRRIQALEAELNDLKEHLANTRRAEEEVALRVEASLSEAAERIERVAYGLASAPEDAALPDDTERRGGST